MNNKNHEWLNDYQDFLTSEKSEVPAEVKRNTFQKINLLINPNSWVVFLKLLGIHSVVGFLSLSICHQFGLNPFNTERSLADWFMSVGGHHFCMLGCGVLFVSVSILTAGYFFTVEEIRALRRKDLIHNASLGLLSLGIFAAFGAEMALSIAGLWLLGGLIGGFLAMATVFKAKGVLAT